MAAISPLEIICEPRVLFVSPANEGIVCLEGHIIVDGLPWSV